MRSRIFRHHVYMTVRVQLSLLAEVLLRLLLPVVLRRQSWPAKAARRREGFRNDVTSAWAALEDTAGKLLLLLLREFQSREL